MRGPLLSGALGSAASLRRLVECLRGRTPVLVRSLWLASTLAAELPVVGLVAAADRGGARKALRKPRAAGALLMTVAGDTWPVTPGAVGALVIEDVVAGGRDGLRGALAPLVPLLRPGGLLVSADRTRDPDVEAELAVAFLAAGLTHISQDRPREGALFTHGQAPHAAVTAALSA